MARIAIIGDTHVPFLESDPFEWALRHIKAFKPTHIVHLGDLFEAAGASVHPNEYSHDLADEYAAGATMLSRLEGAAPNAKRFWILGNHDQNIAAEDPRRIPKAIRKALHWSKSREYGSVFDRWRQIPYRFDEHGVLQIGQIAMFHDFDGAWDLNAIRINNEVGGYANRLIVSGHRHRVFGPEQVMRTKKVELPLWGASPGTLGPLRPTWALRQQSSWGHGLCLVEALKGRACQPKRNWACTTLEYGAK